ncbi:MAG TPA: NUDIX hydrolase [Cellvibrionaceae bacterium]|nr:NUDIX hydrolase [Cellvibrionaceae bacterium]HMW47264.1 NUDIX hydrolase [Cellvibrionaceae bacterium]HMW71205.1 NUDIX hydrolase [Cellvibrionaceae bacterium]HMY39152.1 NUDIX hydrolase [Marinagarivorans sp.]HNG59132.1 NUDIX hydrolase [Cellvibrionaceae bacterium]
MQWTPHVTVATVVEQNGKFLLVHEQSDGRAVYNQPAGHWDEHETLFEAARRETLEETGWVVELSYLLGISHYISPINGFTYLRITFVATPLEQIAEAKLDADIIEAVWLSLDEIQTRQTHLRSPLVLNDINRYLRGEQFPLSLIQHIS